MALLKDANSPNEKHFQFANELTEILPNVIWFFYSTRDAKREHGKQRMMHTAKNGYFMRQKFT